MSKLGQYFLALIFILIAFLKPLQLFVARGLMLNDGDKVSKKGQYAYMIVVLLMFTIFFVFLRNNGPDVQEDFFFTVSSCNPKCSGAYYGKPATFQFSEIKQAGEPCTTDDCPSYGMIRGCNTARVYGQGYAPYTYKCREGIC